MEKVDSVKVKYVCVRISIIIQKMIRTYHAKKLAWLLRVVTFYTLSAKYEFLFHVRV